MGTLTEAEIIDQNSRSEAYKLLCKMHNVCPTDVALSCHPDDKWSFWDFGNLAPAAIYPFFEIFTHDRIRILIYNFRLPPNSNSTYAPPGLTLYIVRNWPAELATMTLEELYEIANDRRNVGRFIKTRSIAHYYLSLFHDREPEERADRRPTYEWAGSW